MRKIDLLSNFHVAQHNTHYRKSGVRNKFNENSIFMKLMRFMLFLFMFRKYLHVKKCPGIYTLKTINS